MEEIPNKPLTMQDLLDQRDALGDQMLRINTEIAENKDESKTEGLKKESERINLALGKAFEAVKNNLRA